MDYLILDWSPSNACLKVCGLKRFRWHAGCPEVSRCHTRGGFEESVVHRQQACKQRNPPWFRNPGHTLSEVQNRVSVVAQKGLMSSKYFFKKIFKKSSVTDLPDRTALLIVIRSMVWPCLMQNLADSPHPTVLLQVLYRSQSYLFSVAFSSTKTVIYKILHSLDSNQEGYLEIQWS